MAFNTRIIRNLTIDAFVQVHLEYLEAGADILVTSSYQVRRFVYLFIVFWLMTVDLMVD